MAQAVEPVVEKVVEDEDNDVARPSVLRVDEQGLQQRILGPEVVLEEGEEMAVEATDTEVSHDYIRNDLLCETATDGAPSVDDVVVSGDAFVVGHSQQDVFDETTHQEERDSSEEIIFD